MKLSLGADERSPVVTAVLKQLKQQGHQVIYYGPKDKGNVPWPEVARCVAEDVSCGRSQEGVLFCWTGTGVSIAANKVPGVRAALCADAETARGARLWNDANVLCLSIRTTTVALAQEILSMWFATKYQPNPTDDACLSEIAALDDLR
jgi:ribose 5-phosphate isomerase B